MEVSYQVTKLPDITKEEIFKINPKNDCYQLVTKWLSCFIGKMYGGFQVTRLPDISKEECV